MSENTDQLSDAIRFWLNDYLIEPRRAPIKSAAIHLGRGLLVLLTVAVHVTLSLLWLLYTLLRGLGDLLVRALAKIMPTPKPARDGEVVGK